MSCYFVSDKINLFKINGSQPQKDIWWKNAKIMSDWKMRLTSKLLLPVARDLTSLGLHGLFALSSTPGALPGAQPTISAGGHTHTPLPFSTVRLLHFLFWKEGEITPESSLTPT